MSHDTNIIQQLAARLHAVYDPREATAIARTVMERCFDITLTQVYAGTARTLSQEETARLDSMAARLLRHEPVQYVMGEGFFMGHRFKVSPAVLIPRPETEELVARVVSDYEQSEAPRLLDAGTGSGCIAISLQLAMPQAHVTGIDISEDAIKVAKENAARLHADIRLLQADLLRPETLPRQPLDAIVSNPPYVRMQEREAMEPHVKDFEPHTALFVPDDDALLFYRAIAVYGQHALTSGGRIYAEINSALGEETAALLRAAGYRDVCLHQDIFHKTRFITCRKQP